MRYRFTDCLLDTDRHLLERAGAAVPVEPQVFDLILLLAQNPGRLVTRDEIVAAVWQGRVVSESTISARIAAARKAVGDDGQRQAVIRTVARRGLQMAAAVDTASVVAERPAAPSGEQRIRYTRDAERRSIAWALTGDGPPLFRLGYNTTHLEAEWHAPCERTTFDRLAAHFRLLRYDPVGFGMSDRTAVEIDFARIADNAICAADAAGFDRFAAYAESGGVHTAIQLAVRHPDRVSKLVIVGGYADGRARRSADPVPESFHALIVEGWSNPDSSFAGASLYPYFPEGPLDAVQAMARNLQQAASRDAHLAMRTAIDRVSSAALLPQVRCPALILHARHDAVHPLSEAQKLAAGLPDAELVVLETANHIPIPGNAIYDHYIETLVAFLTSDTLREVP